MKHIIEFQKNNGLVADGIIGKMTIQKMRCEFGVNTDAQMAHFLANVHHETGVFKADAENLNYSSERLLKVFPKYFKDSITARQYANNPMAIGDKVYANRMGNGNESTGDGYKFRGRGSLQLTGKDNYRAFSGFVKDINVMLTPDIVSSKYFWQSALFYFTNNNLWELMKGTDEETIKKVRKSINGGYNGLNEVQELFHYYYKLITK